MYQSKLQEPPEPPPLPLLLPQKIYETALEPPFAAARLVAEEVVEMVEEVEVEVEEVAVEVEAYQPDNQQLNQPHQDQ